MKSIKLWMICGALMVAAVAGCGGSTDEGGDTGNAVPGGGGNAAPVAPKPGMPGAPPAP